MSYNKTIARLVAEELGTTLGRRLGAGSCGTAFKLGNGRALKITNQDAEYHKSTELIGQKNDHLCEIYETFIINYEDETRYAIVQELLSTKIEPTLRELEDNTDVQYTARRLVRRADSDAIDAFRTLKRAYPKYRKLIEQYRLIAVDCRFHNFGSADILKCNIGQRKGSDKLVMFDFGYAKLYKKSTRSSLLNLTPKDWVENKIRIVHHRGRQLGHYLQNIV